MKKCRAIVLGLVTIFPLAGFLGGQAEPLAVPLALSGASGSAAETGRWQWRLSAAESALEGGYGELARRFYAEVLSATGLTDALRREAQLGLASSLITLGEGELAYTVISEMDAGGGGCLPSQGASGVFEVRLCRECNAPRRDFAR